MLDVIVHTLPSLVKYIMFYCNNEPAQASAGAVPLFVSKFDEKVKSSTASGQHGTDSDLRMCSYNLNVQRTEPLV